ncbi:MAG: hypothetical protein MUE81_17665 [Thermoflexibacter sp.]|jgi:hypothetical protein|nr:hypothetical protein [Thermoflexibacter sp.]
MPVKNIVEKIEQALAHTPVEAQQQLFKELGKVIPSSEKTGIEGRIGWNHEEKEQKIYTNIALKISPCAPQEQKNLASTLENILQKASPELWAEIEEAIDFLLSYAEKPYHLHISPTLLIGDTGMIRFYFLGTAMAEVGSLKLEKNLEKIA